MRPYLPFDAILQTGDRIHLSFHKSRNHFPIKMNDLFSKHRILYCINLNFNILVPPYIKSHAYLAITRQKLVWNHVQKMLKERKLYLFLPFPSLPPHHFGRDFSNKLKELKLPLKGRAILFVGNFFSIYMKYNIA